ncbi:MlaD family protein [Fodinibius sp. Rm-B-1B1-1]|uniref:MlaD family protein n=1 Tax=Fodinibius alkaliphilus TaxID=3140241 RepID=UPI00315ABB42
MKISNELKVALTILVALAIGFIGYRVMSDLPMFRQSQIIHSTFDRTDGLSPGNYIYINGVKVGSVKKMELMDSDSVAVTLSFELGVGIPQNSVAYLQSSGLLDEKAIVVERGDSPEMLSYGDTIEGKYRAGMMETFKDEGEALSEDVSESFEQLNSFLAQLNDVLDDEAKGKIDSVFQNLNYTSDQIATVLENERVKIESSIRHAERVLANVDTMSTRNKSRVDSVLAGLDTSIDELEVLSKDLRKTNSELQDILVKINSGEGSLGKMVNDPALYDNLESMSREMDSLIKNINENPRKYLKHMRLIEVF